MEDPYLEVAIFSHGQNYCFPWLFALFDHLPVVSWRKCLGTKPSSHAGVSSDESYLRWENPDWCGRQRTPLPSKRNNLLEKIKPVNGSYKRWKRSRKSWISPWLGFTRKEFQFPFKDRAELLTEIICRSFFFNQLRLKTWVRQPQWEGKIAWDPPGVPQAMDQGVPSTWYPTGMCAGCITSWSILSVSPCSPLHRINNSSTFSYVGCLICCKRQNIHSVCTGGRFPARDVCRAVKPRKRKGRVQGCVSLRCDKQLLFLPTFHFFLHERCKKTTP